MNQQHRATVKSRKSVDDDESHQQSLMPPRRDPQKKEKQLRYTNNKSHVDNTKKNHMDDREPEPKYYDTSTDATLGEELNSQTVAPQSHRPNIKYYKAAYSSSSITNKKDKMLGIMEADPEAPSISGDIPSDFPSQQPSATTSHRARNGQNHHDREEGGVEKMPQLFYRSSTLGSTNSTDKEASSIVHPGAIPVRGPGYVPNMDSITHTGNIIVRDGSPHSSPQNMTENPVHPDIVAEAVVVQDAPIVEMFEPKKNRNFFFISLALLLIGLIVTVSVIVIISPSSNQKDDEQPTESPITTENPAIQTPMPTIRNLVWHRLGQVLFGKEDNFGTSVSLSSNGTILAVGAPAYYPSGQVQVFELIDDQWKQKGQYLTGEADIDLLGWSVSLSNDSTTLAVGALCPLSLGWVKVFNWINNQWEQKGQALYGEAEGDLFGFSLSLSSSGTVVAVGSVSLLNDFGEGSAGRVKVFNWFVDEWKLKGQILDGEAEEEVYFGMSTSLSSDGAILAVGAPGNYSDAKDSGQVQVFEWMSSEWKQKGQELNGEAAWDHGFGISVSLSSDGTILAAGSPDGFGSYNGQVKIFEWFGSRWEQKGQALRGESSNDAFGYPVSLSSNGNILAVGARNYESSPKNVGQVKVFEWNSDEWKQLGQSLHGEAKDFQFGWSISLSSDGTILAVGAQNNSQVEVFILEGKGV